MLPITSIKETMLMKTFQKMNTPESMFKLKVPEINSKSGFSNVPINHRVIRGSCDSNSVNKIKLLANKGNAN